jgi:hypothetical protein
MVRKHSTHSPLAPVCKSVTPETSTVTEHAGMIRPTAEQSEVSPPGIFFVSHVADDRAIARTLPNRESYRTPRPSQESASAWTLPAQRPGLVRIIGNI